MSNITELIQFTTKNTEITPRLKALTEDKFKRLKRHADNITSIHITFEVKKLRHIAKAIIYLPGIQINAADDSEDMYKSIDGLIEKLIRQLDSYRGKHRGHR